MFASDHYGVLAEVQIVPTAADPRTRLPCSGWRTSPIRTFAASPARGSRGDFLNKRALGTLNLVVNRRRKHRMELLADLARGPARARAPTTWRVTGDLGNVALDSRVGGGAALDRRAGAWPPRRSR